MGHDWWHNLIFYLNDEFYRSLAGDGIRNAKVMRRLWGSVSLELDSESWKGVLNPKIWLLIFQLNLSMVSVLYSNAICCKFSLAISQVKIFSRLNMNKNYIWTMNMEIILFLINTCRDLEQKSSMMFSSALDKVWDPISATGGWTAHFGTHAYQNAKEGSSLVIMSSISLHRGLKFK